VHECRLDDPTAFSMAIIILFLPDADLQAMAVAGTPNASACPTALLSPSHRHRDRQEVPLPPVYADAYKPAQKYRSLSGIFTGPGSLDLLDAVPRLPLLTLLCPRLLTVQKLVYRV
jgi:hypothetical protein